MWCSYIKHTCVNTHKKGSWRKRKYIITGSDVVHGHQDQQRDNILALSKNSFHSLYYLLGVVWDKPLLLISQTYARICHHTVTTFSHVTRTMASSAAKGVVADRRETYRVMVPKLPLKKKWHNVNGHFVFISIWQSLLGFTFTVFLYSSKLISVKLE